ncbi:hypothetical protein [Natronobiforma cellulositropha]|uniref:hypothetical protein n=1 Tax=Natronobiforma cellulositropha TaxID=1679076 RepID=UPI0021D5D6AC|nr:hypothetical protein [Natronobiforma cellulositropha]
MGQSGLLDFTDLQTQEQLDLFVQQNIKQDESESVRGITFLSDDSPSDIVRENELGNISVEVTEKDEFTKLKVIRTVEHSKYDGGSKEFVGDVYIISNKIEKSHTAFSICNKDIFEKCVKGYLPRLPGLSTSYLTTPELRGVLDVLDDQIAGDIIVEEAVIKSPNSKTDILYLKEPYYNLFNAKKVDEGDFYVDKIKFTITGRSSFSGFLSRQGDTRYSRGSSDIYFDYLLDIVGEALVAKGSIFEGKAREYGSRDASRLEIEYEPGTIRGKEANYELIDALGNMSSSSITVYHKNPYMHASVLDFNDGTTADVFITSDKKISIIPGFEASKGSLSRICERINSHFKEGEVAEADSGNPDFDDFFSG